MHKYLLQRREKSEKDFICAVEEHLDSSVKIPLYSDLRTKAGIVYDQLQLGSCSANGGSFLYAFAKGTPSTVYSRLFLYLNERKIEGTVSTDSGATNRDVGDAMLNYGMIPEKDYPYLIQDFASIPCEELYVSAKKNVIKSYSFLKNLTQIKQNLSFLQRPTLIGMNVYDSFESDDIAKTGIMSMPMKGESNLGGHDVSVVGHVDIVHQSLLSKIAMRFVHEKLVQVTYPQEILDLIAKYKVVHPNSDGFLIIRNSWGTEWGINGHFLMPYEYFSEFTFDYMDVIV